MLLAGQKINLGNDVSTLQYTPRQIYLESIFPPPHHIYIMKINLVSQSRDFIFFDFINILDFEIVKVAENFGSNLNTN
jgi:hypothetical protein